MSLDARLLVTPAQSGAVNMALDEVLLRDVGEHGPIVRVYTWSPATLTLGYGQPSADVDSSACARHGVEITRRLTGGRAVLHYHELTYSVIVPSHLVPTPRDIAGAYQTLSGGVVRALAALGVEVVCRPRGRRSGAAGRDPACFATALGGDLSVAGRKLVGSAQCHRYGGILQHGSVPVRADRDLLSACLRRPPEAVSSWTCLSELGLEPDLEAFAAAVADGFAPLFGAPPRRCEPTEEERQAAAALAAEKYATEAWIQRL